MLDAAALASSSLAVVAGSGGGSSRPPSRMVTPSGGAVGAVDLMERYASLLARCEAWQAKLRVLGAPYEESSAASVPAGEAAAASAAVPPSPPRPTASPLAPGASRSVQRPPGSCEDAAAAIAVDSRSSSPVPPAAPGAATQTRYVAIIDDTAHPEVRNVVNAAVRLLSPAWALDPVDQVTEVAKPESTPDDDSTGPAGAQSGGSRPVTAAIWGSPGSRAATPGLYSARGPPGAAEGPPGGTGGSGGGGGGGGVGGGVSAGAGARCHMWNVMWSWSIKARVPTNELLVWQRVNHFSEARQLTRKDFLKKHLAKYQNMHNTGRSAMLFDRLIPTTFVLPKEAPAFEEAFVRALHGVEPTCVQPMGLNLWIQKPVGLSRGRGISLITSIKKVNTAEPMIVQRYLTDPLLVEGHKFDLRLYVLVTSFNPLEAWMYEEGFARFTTLPYTLDESELGNMYVHLTNSSVQRTRAEAGQLPTFLQSAEPAGGSKTSLATLRQLLARKGVDWATLWARLCEVTTAALFAAQDAIPHSPNSFELFGFDMMIDAQLKVWLLEVNSSPSMGLDTPLDRAVKPRLIADVLELLAPLPFDRQALATASDNATKVPLSKKCKLDIKRKHLRAAIPGCLAVNSYAVNLQLQIDGESLPELYKCTIKKHVNNKTSCVSYRLQGTGIYNHLRGLYMRGFCSGEEPGVVVLVASSKATSDLPYEGQSDGEDGEDAQVAARHDGSESEGERRPQRLRRPPPRQQQRKQPPKKKRRKDLDSDSDYKDEEEAHVEESDEEEGQEEAVAGPSGTHYHVAAAYAHHHYPHHQPHEQQHHADQFLASQQGQQQQHTRQRRQAHLRSHPVHAVQSSPEDAHPHRHQHHQHQHHHQHHHQVGLHAHALSGAEDDGVALACADDDGVSVLVGSGVEEDVAAAVAEVERRAAAQAEAERRAAQAVPGPGPGSCVPHLLPHHLPQHASHHTSQHASHHVDPFDHVAIGVGLGVGVGGLSGVGGMGGVDALGGGSILNSVGPVPSGLLGLGPHRDSSAAGPLHLGDEHSGPHQGTDSVGISGPPPQHMDAAMPGGSYHAHRDVLDIPLGLSPFSPGMLHELTGRPHPPRHPTQTGNAWASLPPLDFESNHLWPDTIGLGALL
ncbi:hypothetical protein GPECTOR_22g769 [Gonium pectorale]|uniref:Tubulin--tyrosine ligase-like protein 9 n=1 Tax=Gonium pectorale TaxID=33097 RepID=A0A150GHB4_GONPE|nr:hypothetical protein GPECTOR_22g769 [Gonium pectorale]|eukprot:KXZ49179.1 hypothetical protein GPECTOR_22g769 [Gonium pectorale]